MHVLLLKEGRCPQMREGSEWGSPRGDIGSLVCSVRTWQHSDADTPRYLWTKYSVKVK